MISHDGFQLKKLNFSISKIVCDRFFLFLAGFTVSGTVAVLSTGITFLQSTMPSPNNSEATAYMLAGPTLPVSVPSYRPQLLSRL